MQSTTHSSRTSPSEDMSPQLRPNEEEQDEEMPAMVWDVSPGIIGVPSRYDPVPPPRLQTKVITNEKPPAPKPPVKSDCPAATGKVKHQFSARKTLQEAIRDCGDDESLKKAVRACFDSEEYKQGKTVPSDLLTALSEVMTVRGQSKCRFPACGKVNVRTDRAKEHARGHIGNHPYGCTRVQANGKVGCGATFLRKHDRNRHDSGGDVLRCFDCGATIQGKGREYNLQRHKSNYCPVRKAAKQTAARENPSSQSPDATPLATQNNDPHSPSTQPQPLPRATTPSLAQSQPSTPQSQLQVETEPLPQPQLQAQVQLPIQPMGITGPIHGSLAAGPGLMNANNNTPTAASVTVSNTGPTVTAGGN